MKSYFKKAITIVLLIGTIGYTGKVVTMFSSDTPPGRGCFNTQLLQQSINKF